ncbi:MAG: NAD(P)H-binding protein [Verrucomicrobiota bacterium JB022]|nr:NAD(P)H-binding protein [Verrucomicrobiota bacterium JB022]
MNTHTHSKQLTPGAKVLVVGGTGLIGAKLVASLRQSGYDAVAASPSRGVNAVTGEGLAEAIRGTQVVVDVSNAPSFEDQAVFDFFSGSTRNLVAAARDAGVQHYIALSIVGTDRLLASGYFRAKLEQERQIAASGIPYTIVRATQFFEFVDSIAYVATQGQVVRASSVQMQPILADDVVALLVEDAASAPQNRIVDIAGPEVIRQDAFLGQFLTATEDARRLVVDPDAGYFGIPVEDDSLVPLGEARLGQARFGDWLAARTQKVTA